MLLSYAQIILLMREALVLAEKAGREGEVPVGAVVTKKDGTIIGKGHNQVEHTDNSTKHAEIVAISKAGKSLKEWRLNDCIIFITAEPCTMCTGAIFNSRISTIIYGARQQQMGALGSLYDLSLSQSVQIRPRVIGGVLEDECSAMLTKFFKSKR